MRGMRMFFMSDRSTSTSRGPISWLRRSFPCAFRQSTCPLVELVPPWLQSGAIGEPMGTVGKTKQPGLMYFKPELLKCCLMGLQFEITSGTAPQLCPSTPSVGSLGGEPMLRPGPDLGDHSVVVRVAIEEQAEDFSGIRILLHASRWIHSTAIDDLNIRGSHLVHVLRLKWHVQTVRPDVADQCR